MPMFNKENIEYCSIGCLPITYIYIMLLYPLVNTRRILLQWIYKAQYKMFAVPTIRRTTSVCRMQEHEENYSPEDPTAVLDLKVF